jgi:hypothetical protein
MRAVAVRQVPRNHVRVDEDKRAAAVLARHCLRLAAFAAIAALALVAALTAFLGLAPAVVALFLLATTVLVATRP